MATKHAPEPHFHWSPQPAARALIDELLVGFLEHIPGAATLAQRMRNETGTRFVDWVDYVQVRRSADLRSKLKAAGFARKPVPGAQPANLRPAVRTRWPSEPSIASVKEASSQGPS